MDTTQTPPPSTAWQAESLRLTAMYSPDKVPLQKGAWKEVTGEEPSETHSRSSPEMLQEFGNLGNCYLIATQTDSFFNWSFHPSRSNKSHRYPNVGTYPEALDGLKKIADRWLPTSRPIQRLSFGAMLFQPLSNHIDLNHLLAKYTSSVKVDPEAWDIIFQVNWKKKNKFGDLELIVNKVSTWNTPSSGDYGPADSIPRPDFALRVDIDINNNPLPPGEAIPASRANEVFLYFMRCANEIAEKGDAK